MYLRDSVSGPARSLRRLFQAGGLLSVAVLLQMAFLPLTSTAGSTPPLLKRDWIEVKTPNFTVNSVIGEEKTLELAAELETLRQFILAFTAVKDDAAPIPTEFFVLKRQSDIRKWVDLKGDVVGFFSPTDRQNVIVMGGSRKFATHVIQHEYVHYVMSNDSAFHRLPAWVKEGFAEYFGSVYLKKDRLILGDIPEMRRDWLVYEGWISSEKLIRGQENLRRKENAMFYAQSWLLVHYLSLGREDRNLHQDMTAYIAALEAGTPDIEAFEEAFGIELDSLQRTLRKHGSAMSGVAIPSDTFTLDYTPRVRDLSKAEAADRIANAMLNMGTTQNVEPLVEYALAQTPDSGLAWANSARLKASAQADPAAFADAKKAIELDPQNPYPLLDMAQLVVGQVQADSEIAQKRKKKMLSRAAQYCLRAWKLDPSVPDVYATYGTVLLEGGEKPEKAVEMLEEASLLLPSSMGIRFMLAQALHASGQETQAVELARSILSATHLSASLAERVSESLAQWSQAEQQGVLAQADSETPS